MSKENIEKEIELEEMNIFLKIPTTTISLNVEAEILDDDNKPVKCTKKMKFKDIQSARKDFLEYVEDGDDYNVRYVVTDNYDANN